MTQSKLQNDNFSVCLVKVDVPIDYPTLAFLLRFSPLEKQQRISRQRVKKIADAMAVGGALVRYMLRENFCVPIDAQIAYGKFGKPYLPDYPKIHFNISHSGKFVACAVCNRPIGIDVQEITPYRPNVAARVFSSTDLEQISTSHNQAEEFTKIWTQKEAYLKMLGVGFRTGTQIVKFSHPLKMQTQKYQTALLSIAIDGQSST